MDATLAAVILIGFVSLVGVVLLVRRARKARASRERALRHIVARFLNGETWEDSRSLVEAHPELLSDEAYWLLGRLTADAEAEGAYDVARALEEHRALLHHLRQERKLAALSETMGLPAIERVETQVEVHGAPGARQAASGSPQGEVPEELEPIVDELSGPSGPSDMPRRIKLCERALTMLDQETNVSLWAALQIVLANALIESPAGDTAENRKRAIEHYERALALRGRQPDPERWAAAQHNLAKAYVNRTGGDRVENVERAIRHGEQALEVFTRDAHPERWAATHDVLASAFVDRTQGDRAENVERAIRHGEEALEVLTRDAHPERWATAQQNLASAYVDRIRDDRAENLARAIYHCERALEVRTRQADPEGWASIQNSLGTAYADRVPGNRAENLERAIDHFRQALEVRTRAADPERWAATQNNLAAAYKDRVRGERAENLERAIHHFELALEVYTREASPAQWALTHNNLAVAYQARIRGERGDNVERGIGHYERALEVYSPGAFPERWAAAQNNLANAYAQRMRGERAENVERAFHHYEQALKVYTRRAFPADWASTQSNLGHTYVQRIRGERAENVERAIHHYQQALEVYTRQAFPADWAMTQNALANATSERQRGDRAENLERAIQACRRALSVYTRESDPERWAMIQVNLANGYRDRIRGDRAENVERAIHHYEKALEVRTPEAFPARWAATQSYLASAYSRRVRGDRAENLERAIDHYEQALTFYTVDLWPEQAQEVLRDLGTAHFAARHWRAAHEAFAVARDLTARFYGAALLREARERQVGVSARMVARDAFCLARVGELEEAWRALEAGRARALRRGLNRARARRALAAAAPAVRERYESLSGEERALREALQLPADDPGSRPYHEVRPELASVTRELRELEKDLLAGAGVDLDVADAGRMRGLPLLEDRQTGVLSLALTDQGTLALLLSGDGLRHTIVPGLSGDDVRTLVRGAGEGPEPGGWLGAYFPQFAAAQARREAATQADLMPGSEARRQAFEEADGAWRAACDRWRSTIADTLAVLGPRLWHGLDEMLQEAGVVRLMLVPQGMLFLLPLHACALGEGERVCDRYTVAYAPAGSVLARLSSRGLAAGGAGRSLLVANPTGDLRHAPSEALAIQDALGDARTLWEGDATEASVVEAARDAEVFHFSGHGRYDWRAPEQSGLLMRASDPEPMGPGNGEGAELVTAAEMREVLHLSRTRLMTLSACETGLVETRRGLADEYIGLPGVLLEAGARAVVASLWAVDDLATALLMWQFYRVWDRGAVPVAEALREAQAWLRTGSGETLVDALERLNRLWEPWRRSDADPRMRDRAIEQDWIIRQVCRDLEDMDDLPFAHPFWWAGFQAVGDVL